MSTATTAASAAASRPLVQPMRVIWSCCEVGPVVEEHVHRVIDLAAREGIHGIEIGGHNTDIDEYIRYEKFPALAAVVDETVRRENADRLQRIIAHAKERNLRVGMWDHELGGPKGMLKLLPEITAADGLLDLDSPVLWDFVREKVAEMFRRFPDLDELVLTMTETAYPVARRPFCDIPVPERIRRLMQAIADVTEPLGKSLVVRPFSAVRSDELNVREAIEALKAKHVSLMYKTEPFDWHPYIENETLIGSVPRYEARAETDCGAEYYGQAVIPACYTQHLEHRLRPANERGATVAVLRVDRGAHHPSLDHPINTANLVPVTRWIKASQTPLDEHLRTWLKQTHGDGSAEFAALLQETFDVIRDALYIDQQAMSHSLYPPVQNAKHILAFALFEQDVPVDHLDSIWSVVPGRRTLKHPEILTQKRAAVKQAAALIERFEAIAPRLKESSRPPLREALARLEVFARACEQLCRLILAHLADVWDDCERITGTFEQESKAQLAIADEIDRRFGLPFFPATDAFRSHAQMTHVMRQWVEKLGEERALELPLRQAIAAEPGLVDYVLCGFASEGHRPSKRLHSGKTFAVADRFVRESGAGEEDGFGYTLRTLANRPTRLAVQLHDDGVGRPCAAAIAGAEHRFDEPAFDGFKTWTIDLPPQAGDELKLRFWSTTLKPLRTATIKLFERH